MLRRCILTLWFKALLYKGCDWGSMPTADFAKRVESTLNRIEESEEIHSTNKDLISDFKRDHQLDGLSDARLQKLTSHLKIIAEHLGDTPFSDLSKSDVKDLVEWVQNRDIAETTEADYKKVIKQFYKWLDGEDGKYPDTVDWITTTSPNKNGTLPKDLLTRENIDALKEACRNDRDRAFIAMLYETGARIGELIDLRVGDIEDHTHGRKVVIDGKTGQRRLPLVESTPALNKWLNEHPSGEPDAPLWCQLRNGNEELSYNYIRQKLLERPRERSGIDKPVNPHHFRHSRATELATEFKEAQLCEWFGWVQGSDVPGKYVHLSGRDIDQSYAELHGLRSAEEEEKEEPVTECPRCDELNETGDKFCGRCGFALREEAQEAYETVQQDVGAAKVLSTTVDGLSDEDIESIVDDDALMAELIQRRAASE